ncbi:MAG TPA: LysM peptidoglycan-binding domain-containing protein [Candidatus Dormibacteraeota bacterium]|nr:LysM peptidoglycan-binding domain-containing protein [Candidatus Dormibacteraeota bacterium]
MRVAKLQTRIAILALLALSASSCQTAQKPVALLPPGTAPALAVPVRTPAPPQQQAKPAPPATPPSQPPIKAQPESAPEAKAHSPSSTPTSDPVGDLIVKVEKDFQAGLDAYHAGQTDAAKQDFDHAFNALLESNLDIRSDDRLEKEFDRIVEGVNHLDLSALGFASDSEAQKAEPAPIDETNDITVPTDAKVKAKAQAEIKSTHSDLPLMMTDQVAGYISYFSNRGRGTFERAFARSGRYHDMMVKILKEEGVPQDLIYLAQAESGFHPLAVSRVGARGIWQFMGSRAKGYGLQHSMWVDDRQDPEKSTRAAAHHLKDLYAQFGDWYLAMAAYNSGPGRVQAAVKRTGYADFWELYRRNVLPKETRNYVPIIVAMTIVSKNLSHYGFDDVSMDNPVAFDKITINYPVDLRLVAECVDATPAQLQEMNPSLLRMTTPRVGSFELHLPAGTKDQYQTAIAAVPNDMRLWWRYHKVQPGDTLASLSRSYRVTAKAITTANHLDDVELEAGVKLIIPVAAGKHPVSDDATYARRITRYRVHSGDTVQTVAENFGVSAQMVRRWNGLHNSDSLRGRKVLALHLPVTPSSEPSTASKSAAHARKPAQTVSKAPGGKSAKTAGQESSEQDTSGQAAVLRHTVKSGETLYSIATTYKTTVAALKRNNGNVAVLHPGMVLVVEPSR